MLKKCTNEIKNTAHSKYRCEYHIVLTLCIIVNIAYMCYNTIKEV